MRSSLVRGLTVFATVSLLSGCMFMQWTDTAFIGSKEEPPRHANREWLGAVVMPLAITADIITAPEQLVALMVTGDWGLYMKSDRRRVASLSDGTTRELLAKIEARRGSDPSAGAVETAWGIDSAGHVVDVPVTSDQMAALRARALTGDVEVAMLPLEGPAAR